MQLLALFLAHLTLTNPSWTPPVTPTAETLVGFSWAQRSRQRDEQDLKMQIYRREALRQAVTKTLEEIEINNREIAQQEKEIAAHQVEIKALKSSDPHAARKKAQQEERIAMNRSVELDAEHSNKVLKGHEAEARNEMARSTKRIVVLKANLQANHYGSPTNKGAHADWAGTWECDADGVQTATVSGGGDSYTVEVKWQGEAGHSFTGSYQMRASGANKLDGHGKATYKDPDKTVTWTSTLEMTLSGRSYVQTETYLTREFNWTPLVVQYDSKVAAGSRSFTFTKK